MSNSIIDQQRDNRDFVRERVYIPGFNGLFYFKDEAEARWQNDIKEQLNSLGKPYWRASNK